MRIMGLSGTLKQALVTLLFCLVTIGGTYTARGENPPYTDTETTLPNIISSSDPSSFVTLEALPEATQIMADWRNTEDSFPLKANPKDPNPVIINEIIRIPYLFRATFIDGSEIEVHVNREIGTRQHASESAERYLTVIGQLPAILRTGVRIIWLHKEGPERKFALNQGIYLNDVEAAKFLEEGTLEEILFHEATHTSLDFLHSGLGGEANPDWQAAQTSDGQFISKYGRDNPESAH